MSETSDDPELDKIAELRAAEWGCTRAEARARLLAEAPIVVHVDVDPREDPDAAGRRIADAVQAADPTGKLPVTLSVEGPPGRTSGVREQADDSTLFAASAFAAVTSIETGLWDRYLLRLQATIRARLATEEWAQGVRARRARG